MLHAVEDGLVTLIGATTENPYFEVNQALLSRCTVIELQPLTVEELGLVLERGAAELGADVAGDVCEAIARRSGGDARTALQTLELAWETATAAGQPLSVAHVEDVARKRPLRYDRAGDRHYDLTSAFIKSMRGSDPDAAVYYLAGMLEGGEDARFIARRIVIAASEDVGNADPRALLVAVAAAQAVEHVGLPEAQLNLAQAAIYVARAPKSNAAAQAIWRARRTSGARESPRRRPMLRDSHYRGAEARGHGVGLRLAARRPEQGGDRPPPRGVARARVLSSVPGTARRQRRPRDGDRHGRQGTGVRPRGDTRTAAGPALGLPRPLERPPRLPPVRVHRGVQRGSPRPPGEPRLLPKREYARSSSSRATPSAARQAWKRELGAEYTFASDFWSHGETAKRYGVFNEENGAPIRGTFLIDTDGTVIWSLVKDSGARRTEMVPDSLGTLRDV